MLGNYKVDVVQEAGHALVEGLAGGFGGGAGFEAGEVGKVLGGAEAAEGGDDLEPFGDVEAGFVEAAIRSLN